MLPQGMRSLLRRGTINISRHLAVHVVANKCRNRLQTRHNKTQELDGPYLPTTMGGIHAAPGDIAAHVAAHPNPMVPHAPAVNFCHVNPSFTTEQFRTPGAQSIVASLRGPAKTIVAITITSLLCQAVTIYEERSPSNNRLVPGLPIPFPCPRAAQIGSSVFNG